jgi:peptidyl-prolyl cis-trans isomerase C
MNPNVSSLLLAAVLAVSCTSATAALPPDVLAKNRWVQLTRADYDAAMTRIPEKQRFEFAASPKRVQDLLNTLLLTKTLAAQARAHGTRPQASFAGGESAAPDAERALADAELARVEADANKAFDAAKASHEARALELYKANPEEYRAPEEVRFSDIPIVIAGRGEEAARERAAEARAKIAAGADFAAVAREYSDDPATREKGGALPFTPAKRLAPDFAKAVFAMTTVGEISQPIRAPSAYHVVRLDERRPARVRPYEEVRDAIMAQLRKRYVAGQREARIQSVFRDPETQTNQPAIDALVNRVDPQVFRHKSGSPASAPREK